MLRVLIADDTNSIRSLLRSLLEDHDCDVVGEAMTGKQAIELVAELHPDVVIMDYQMPIMGGIEATHEIKQLYPDVDVFGYTSVPFGEAEKEMLEAGATVSFDKLHLEQLVEALDERSRRGSSQL